MKEIKSTKDETPTRVLKEKKKDEIEREREG
jgi:hypothetical protein